MMRRVITGLFILLAIALAVLVYWKAWGHHETHLLPYYALLTLLRLSVTYVICLVFGLVVGIIAATRDRIGSILIPVLDILQSVPVLGFFPLALAVIIRSFHESSLGLELASMFLLFTSMEWSIVFAVITGIKSMPASVRDMSRIFDIKGWDYIRHVLLPSIYPNLVAGSILAWGGGWYFVIVTEYITFGDKTYSLQGLGYYLQIASFQYSSVWMSIAGLVTVGAIVFLMNRLVWHRLDERAKHYQFLMLHGFVPRQSLAEGFWAKQFRRMRSRLSILGTVHLQLPGWFQQRFRFRGLNYLLVFLALVGVTIGVFYGLMGLPLSAPNLEHIALSAVYSLARLSIAYIIGIALAVGVGYLILQRPATRKIIILTADIAQSIPALAYFPLLWLVFTSFLPERLGLEVAAVLLMLTGMLWYMMFNVIEAVEHWPSEVDEIAGLFSIRGGRYFRHILVPALFPALVTGSILAWGGGFNATIVSEYINIGHQVHSIPGLGSALDKASNAGDTQQLMILLIVMSGTVVLLNHFVWRRLLTRASLHVIVEE